MSKKLRLLLSYEIPFADGRALAGDEYHTVKSLTEPELERIRALILAREQTTHGAALTGPCLFRAVVPLAGRQSCRRP